MKPVLFASLPVLVWLLGACATLQPHPYRIPDPPVPEYLKAQAKAVEQAKKAALKDQKERAKLAKKSAGPEVPADEFDAEPAEKAADETATETKANPADKLPQAHKLRYDKHELLKKKKHPRRPFHTYTFKRQPPNEVNRDAWKQLHKKGKSKDKQPKEEKPAAADKSESEGEAGEGKP